MTTSDEPTAVTTGTEPPLVVVSRATVAFGRSVALERIDLSLSPGGAVALIGPNGAGKSTLLKAMLGLVPLSSGSISVLGEQPALARHAVAYVPQADVLDPDFPVDVLQVVLMGRYRRLGWGRRPKPADRSAALDALGEVGLADHAAERFGTLSGGQRQRVLLARAVAQEPRVLLLDEPFNGLDAASTDVLVGVLNRLRATGAGVVMSTHDLAIAHLTCSDACLLNRHQLAYGPIAESLTPERLAATYGDRAVVLAAGTTFVNTH